MRDKSDFIAVRTTFLLSIAFHCVLLGMPLFNLVAPKQIKPEKEITVEIEIEKPSLLPKIDVMAEEKKFKEIEPPPEEPEPEPEPEVEEAIEEVKNEEHIEVINPEEEAMLRYQDMLKQKIESRRRYPRWAKDQGFEGITELVFTVLSNGAARDIKVVQSAGYKILDREAVLNVQRASPFPPIPSTFNLSFLKIEVEIVFRLK